MPSAAYSKSLLEDEVEVEVDGAAGAGTGSTMMSTSGDGSKSGMVTVALGPPPDTIGTMPLPTTIVAGGFGGAGRGGATGGFVGLDGATESTTDVPGSLIVDRTGLGGRGLGGSGRPGGGGLDGPPDPAPPPPSPSVWLMRPSAWRDITASRRASARATRRARAWRAGLPSNAATAPTPRV